MPWAQNHTQCGMCGTVVTPHVARGLCRTCYQLDNEHHHKAHISGTTHYGQRTASILREDLADDYSEKQMSLSDLARKYDCTRQYIHKLLKTYDIKRRTKAAARQIALSRGKMVFTRTDELGIKSRVVLKKININKKFFKSWSSEMAYVLGVIFTDGNLMPLRKRNANYNSRSSRFSVSQKESELLEKLLALMECDAKLYRGKQVVTGNPIYQFHINDEGIYDDLLALGLTPKKSLTMQFPEVPSSYVRHFIRGCWDGDGSVFFERDRLPGASYVSGSRYFVDKMVDRLVKLGLPKVQIYSANRSKSYFIRFMGETICTKLFHVFYDNVPETMYLTRKFDLFKQIAIEFEGLHILEGKLPLVFPGSLTRSRLADMLGISPVQVTSIMASPVVRDEIKQITDNVDDEKIQKLKRLIKQKSGLRKRRKNRQ